MYSSFHIKNFRGFEDFQIDGLQRINLIAGRNNTGKTSLLEAVYIHARGNVFQALNIQSDRGIEIIGFDPAAPSWRSLFNELDEKRVISIDGLFGDTNRNIQLMSERATDLALTTDVFNTTEKIRFSSPARMLRLARFVNGDGVSEYLVQDEQGYSGKNIQDTILDVEFITFRTTGSSSSIASKFSSLQLLKQEAFLMVSLSIIEPRLLNVMSVSVDNISALYADIGMDELIPLNALGDGIVRLTHILLSIGTSENGVVLIDEIENGFHYSIIGKVWQAIAQAARDFDVQVFATTHSLEMIRAAHEAFKGNDPYDFAYHRLDRNRDGQIEAKTFDEELLEASVEFNFEVR